MSTILNRHRLVRLLSRIPRQLLDGNGATMPQVSRAPAPVLDCTRLTVEARDRLAITSLRLLAVLTVLFKYASPR